MSWRTGPKPPPRYEMGVIMRNDSPLGLIPARPTTATTLLDLIWRSLFRGVSL